MRTLRRLHACPPWCIVDHATNAAVEDRVDWREHTSVPAVFETRLGDLVSVDVVAGDDLQTGETGPSEVRVRVTADRLSPAETLRLAASLMAAAVLGGERSPVGGAS